MIKTVTYSSWRYGVDQEAIVIKKNLKDQSVTIAFPFLEDTPNIEMTHSEAVGLKFSLDEIIGPIKQLEPPKELFPETFISIADQSRLSALLDEYPKDTEADRTARKAIRQAMEVLNLAAGGYER
ncbi:hypothetical protein JJQ72_06450 [Paenibacillus sp. F411]|uniref:hypothetical protein n=1 Tax=Paenibacillus sp. F411 TaxID=2820239 RepID=UPI001AAFE4D9|nr:hypothetical protein [Paenibacillus sp. F411]MBO2943618.1 hypothetical protein [Paenibacillus sp. F411]